MKDLNHKYVTFDQAKWLKEKGYDVPCNGRYYWDTTKYSFSPKGAIQWNKNEDSYPAPEEHEVIDWLWETHGIWISIEPEGTDFNEFRLSCFRNNEERLEETIRHINNDSYHSGYKSPQEAYSAAFDYIKDNNLI
jgi:hypothetical protein